MVGAAEPSSEEDGPPRVARGVYYRGQLEDAMPSPGGARVEEPEHDGGERPEEQEGAGSMRTSERSWERREWSEAEWKQWNSYYVWGAAPSGGGGSVQKNGTRTSRSPAKSTLEAVPKEHSAGSTLPM